METYQKTIIPHPTLYMVKFEKDVNKPYLIFIHGGPGFNCGILEYLIEHHHFFKLLNYNLILYDQRNCGRSIVVPGDVTHLDNLNDLQEIQDYVSNVDITVNGFIGHSYGAKLLFDYYQMSGSKKPGVFVGTTDCILTPRLNNFVLDLNNLKKTDPARYHEVFKNLQDLNLNKFLDISEELTALFLENIDRVYRYWANLDCFKMVQEIDKQLNLKPNRSTLVSIRKDLYANEANFSLDIQSLQVPHIWINGFHDISMNGSYGIIPGHQDVTLFYQSSHYPHIEENDRFCEVLNQFFHTLY